MGCGGSKTEGFDAGDGVESESSEPAPQDIPGAYYASGAAIPQANGVYVRDGTYSGAPLFKNGQLWLLRYTIGTSQWWYIANKDQLDRDDGDLYRVKSLSDLPPQSGWAPAQDGVAPAPTLAAYADAASCPTMPQPVMPQPGIGMMPQPGMVMPQPGMMGRMMPVDTNGDGRPDTMLPVGGGGMAVPPAPINVTVNVQAPQQPPPQPAPPQPAPSQPANATNSVHQPAAQPAPPQPQMGSFGSWFDGRKFAQNNKFVAEDKFGVNTFGDSCLYFDGHGRGTPGLWLSESVFACSPCPFGDGTWAVACSNEGARGCYLDDERGIPLDDSRRADLVAKILCAGQNNLQPWK